MHTKRVSVERVRVLLNPYAFAPGAVDWGRSLNQKDDRKRSVKLKKSDNHDAIDFYESVPRCYRKGSAL